MHFLDPIEPSVFKKIFNNKNVLNHFLNHFLEDERGKITDVTILEPKHDDLLEITCKDQKGKEFIVALHTMPEECSGKEIFCLASRSYADQIDIVKNIYKLKPVFFVGILNFKFASNPHYISRHTFLDSETKENYFKHLNFVLIELPKFNKSEEEIESVVDQWMFFLKNAKNCDSIPEMIREEEIKKAFEEITPPNSDVTNTKSIASGAMYLIVVVR